jgi:threonine dehydrogenase-like Zn-dependent dehydrogenase
MAEYLVDGAAVVDYLDDRDSRLEVAQGLGATAHTVAKSRKGATLDRFSNRYDVVVEASSQAAGLRAALRALKPGGICTATGYYLATGTRVPIMDMYATSATLRVGISHVRPVLPELLDFIATTGFPAEQVTSLLADWDDAPSAYAARTTKVVLHRPPLVLDKA